MCDELEKLARVPKAVKMYRRSLAGLGEGSRSIRQQGGGPAREGFALHGTEGLPGILEDSRIYASPLGETGQHGAGVYWWRGFPREGYLTGPTKEGILTSLQSLKERKLFRPPTKNIRGGHSNVQMALTGPEDYKLIPKDVAVMDTAKRAREGTLGPVMADAQKARARVVDSAIFDRARKDVVDANRRLSGAKNLPPAKEPTKQELMQLLKRREAGIEI